MVKLANPDSSFPVPCRQCAALLQEGHRFCPFCGADQSVEHAGGASTRGATRVPMTVDFADTVQPEVLDASGNLVPASTTLEGMEPEIGLVRPGVFWQNEVAGTGGAGRWARRSGWPFRLLVGIVAMAVLLVLALLLSSIFLDRQGEEGKLRAFKADVERVQGALTRGDLSGAARALGALGADHANDPDVQTLRATVDRRVQEQARREQLQEAAQRASKALGVAEPATTTPPPSPEQRRDTALRASRALGLDEAAAPPAPAPSAPTATTVPIPAPGTGMAEPKEKECNEALAALALCQKK
jgi:hypothetical protein